ncbi:MAG: hypothetical protein Q9208_004989 [Pyrenodesmia sp. 3 TL-2023]
MSKMRDGQEGFSISNQAGVAPASNPPNGDDVFLETIQDIFRLFLVDDVHGGENHSIVWSQIRTKQHLYRMACFCE